MVIPITKTIQFVTAAPPSLREKEARLCIFDVAGSNEGHDGAAWRIWTTQAMTRGRLDEGR
jgi:hypothetical protein